MTSGTYARGDDDSGSGGVIIAAVSILSAILVIAALIYAAGAPARHQAALAAAGCEPTMSPSGLQCTTAQMLETQFMGIVTPSGQQLTTDMAAFTAGERHNLAAAKAALMSEVANERAFGQSVAGMTFPPSIAPMAKALVQANQARVTLTAEQAQAPSLAKMRSFNRQVTAGNAAVESEINLIHKALTAPPAG